MLLNYAPRQNIQQNVTIKQYITLKNHTTIFIIYLQTLSFLRIYTCHIFEEYCFPVAMFPKTLANQKTFVKNIRQQGKLRKQPCFLAVFHETFLKLLDNLNIFPQNEIFSIKAESNLELSQEILSVHIPCISNEILHLSS